MGIRDIVITILIFGSLPLIFWRPYIGILVWSWLSYMNPHKLTFGFAFDMPFAQIVAITLLLAFFNSKDKKPIPVNAIVLIWIFYIVWMGITTLNAIYPENAQEQFIKVVKIQLVTFLTMILITDKAKIDQLIWVIALSIGYFSVKGGIFTILTGGASRVWGPPGGFIQENNTLALATLMTVPLMVYLYKSFGTRVWVKQGLGAAILLSIVSAIGSQSRGALIAILAVSGFFWLKSKGKLLSGIGIVMVALVLAAFLPESWYERMSTIQNYEEDASAMGRINAWGYSINVANDRLTGAGFESWSSYTFSIYAENPTDVHAAHSIYFSPLADHGWIGLSLFMLILFLAWRNLTYVIRVSKEHTGLHDFGLLAQMLQVSFIAYLSGGAFLSLAYFDLPWHVVALTVMIRRLVDEQFNSREIGADHISRQSV